ARGQGWMLTPVVQIVEEAIVLAVAEPAPNAFVQPTFTTTGTVASKDPLASLTVNGMAATVDGLDWSAQITLAEGPGILTAKAIDTLGRSAVVEFGLTADGTPPLVAILFPEMDELVTSSEVEVEAILFDAVSAVDPGSVQALWDGTDRTDELTVTADAVTGILTAEDGVHTLDILASDLAGNLASASSTFWVYTTTVEAVALIGPEGGRVEVTDPDSPLAGAFVHFPDGAFVEDTVVSVAIAAGVDPAAGPPPGAGVSPAAKIETSSD
ncbi:unnamed protein product, partial [marine sediment metagenome]